MHDGGHASAQNGSWPPRLLLVAKATPGGEKANGVDRASSLNAEIFDPASHGSVKAL